MNDENKKDKGTYLEQRVEKIFRESGYKTEMNYYIESNSGEQYEIDVYAEYEGELHTDKVVIECKNHKNPLGRDPIMKVKHILQNTPANKGIVVCPSGFTSGAISVASSEGIELLDKSDLPKLMDDSEEYNENDSKNFIQKIDNWYKLELLSYNPISSFQKFICIDDYIVSHRERIYDLTKQTLFTVKFSKNPDKKAFEDSFKRNKFPLSKSAIFLRDFKNKWIIFDRNNIYGIERSEQNNYEIYTYPALSNKTKNKKYIYPTLFDKMITIKQNFRLKNNSKRTLERLVFRGNLTVSKGNKLSKLVFDVPEDTYIFDEASSEYSGHLYPSESLNFSVKTSIPLKTYTNFYDKLGLQLMVKESSKILEKRYYDISVSKGRAKKILKESFKDFEKEAKKTKKVIETNIKEAKRELRGCFIATAVYGSPNSSEIDILRKFRDKFLLKSDVGNLATNIYYKLSPPIASFISRHDILREMVGQLIVYPSTKLAQEILSQQ